jgi:hypothetical protein
MRTYRPDVVLDLVAASKASDPEKENAKANPQHQTQFLVH